MYDHHFIWLTCAILYALCLGWGASHTEQWLSRPRVFSRTAVTDANFCSGDLLLWSTTGTLHTDVEKLLCGSQYTHVALVFVDAAGCPFLWDCVRAGHRTLPLIPYLQKTRHRQTCFWRRINKPVDSVRMEEFIRLNKDQQYSFNMWQGVARRWYGFLNLPHSTRQPLIHSRFCSQLVAETYVFLGVLDFSWSDLSPQLILPGDFAAVQSDKLPYTHGYSLGCEIELT